MKELPETVVPLSAKWILLDSTDLFEVHIADLVCQLLPVKGTKVQWHSNKQCTHALYMYMYVARTCIPHWRSCTYTNTKYYRQYLNVKKNVLTVLQRRHFRRRTPVSNDREYHTVINAAGTQTGSRNSCTM